MLPLLSFVTILALLGPSVMAIPRIGGRMAPPPIEDETFVMHSRLAKRSAGVDTFEQYISHADPSLGTFSQKFFWDSTFWGGPGYPVVLMSSGEGRSGRYYTGYMTNAGLTGQFAEAIRGAAIVLEHRYYGDSSPFENLTVENLQYLTLENSIKDLTNFARHATLPFDVNGTSSAPKAAWVLSGGSYAGALSAWVEQLDPSTFWAYHASSAVVEAVGDFWQYWVPVMEGLPQNCSADVANVVEHVDKILTEGSAEEKEALKSSFGVDPLMYDDDFGYMMGQGPGNWQGHDFDTGYSSVYKFCDYLENADSEFHPNASSPGSDGVGTELALSGWAAWTKSKLLPGVCPRMDANCFNSHNSSLGEYTNLRAHNTNNRQWWWFLCNEPLEWWQTGAPEGRPSIVSRLINADFFERQCALYFPPENSTAVPDKQYNYGISQGAGVDRVNRWTGGWTREDKAKRVLFVNGEFDPWRYATVSSPSRPGGPLKSTGSVAVLDIPGGVHCSDMSTRNGIANAAVRQMQDQTVQIIKCWVDQFRPPANGSGHGLTGNGRWHHADDHEDGSACVRALEESGA